MKNTMIFSLLMSGLLLISLQGQAYSPEFFHARIDDREMSGRHLPFRGDLVSPDLVPDKIETADDPSGGLTIVVLREDHGQLLPLPGLTFKAANLPGFQLATTDLRGFARGMGCPSFQTSTMQMVAPLSEQYFKVSSGWRGAYQVTAQIPCRGIVKLYFKSDSNGGQALGIWQIAQKAKAKLAAEIGLGFWKNPINFSWPADGDYYMGGTVSLTRGDYWDVVGHEMGHAIYDLGGLGVFGGGQHKIDECYSDALALSEGWASFFSAWVSVDLRDPDAKFEYMVPRRAPLRFENIPSDVCLGVRNEWRVTGFFWDLNDLHEDGENSAVPFRTTWTALLQHGARDMNDVRNLLLKSGANPALLQTIWNLNFDAGK